MLLLVGLGGQAQTATKNKPKPAQQQVVETPPAVSDSFAKIALHVLIAMRNSDGSTVAAGHIETLLEDMELAQSTPTEKFLTQYFGLQNRLHLLDLQGFAQLPPTLRANPKDQLDLKRDYACFDAYQVLLKANDSKTDLNHAPPICLEKTSTEAFSEGLAPVSARLEACQKAAGSDSVAFVKCTTEYQSAGAKLMACIDAAGENSVALEKCTITEP